MMYVIENKPDIPFRPIVCSINSITYELSSHLKDIILPLVRKRRSTVTNSKPFVEEIRAFTVSPTDILVSYDVKDLFISIPIPYTINILQDLLYTDNTLPGRTKLNPFQITKLVSFCMMEGNFFHFQGRFFKQKGGAPVGSPLSPVLAEIFMEHLEDRAFSEANQEILPRRFKRYVDDIFVLIQSGREDTFLNFLNGLFPGTISFTIEKEVSGKLPFLDSLEIRSPDRFKTTVYSSVSQGGGTAPWGRCKVLVGRWSENGQLGGVRKPGGHWYAWGRYRPPVGANGTLNSSAA
ncbi:hypothetical protein M513_12152 [Trichuris suis]|uniref:Reverse transcriptase domain-containing protein n=1 Tax=Trichuris suis TaxID=68888 RepID=A0A085LPR6_9BILA|nr:hypothetical protein M513_12152 [Trichuris suis]